MAKFATAYIEIRPELKGFGAGLEKEVQARLGDIDISEDVDRKLRPKFAGVGRSLAEAISSQTDDGLRDTVQRAFSDLGSIPKTTKANVDLQIRQAEAEAARLRAELADLGRQTVTPEVKVDTTRAKLALDDIKVRLARLRAEKAEIKVDIDRSVLSHLSGAAGSIGAAFHGIAVSVGGLLGIGGALTGLGQAAAAALPLVAALAVAIGVLAASFGAAVAGAGALGIALAGALGPAAIVAFAALAKVAQIIKAIHADGQDSGAGINAAAAAQDQLRGATDGLAAAQDNLRQQTTAAYQAWADAAERVRDDILDIESAQEGIDQASINLREAQLELKKFKSEVPGLQGLFKKFTDVNVDFSGLKKALAEARKGSGGKLSGEDSLKLEQLILNIRKAKTGEKEATDRLHDANVSVQRDRRTEAEYLRKGIAAYPGYTSAVRNVAQAQRSLAAAQRSAAAAANANLSEVSKLAPLEQKLAATFKLIGAAFNKALGPALTALFTGVNRGLRTFLSVLKDPHIIRSLRAVGAAMGDAFVALAKFLASKEGRQGFEGLARGAAQLVRVIGTRAFVSFSRILLAIAKTAMPALVGLFRDLADVLDHWADWIQKHPKRFKKNIDDLIGSFKGWLGVIIDIGGFLLDLGGKLKGLGDTAGRIFRGIKDSVSSLLGDTDKLRGNVTRLHGQDLTPLTKEPPLAEAPKPKRGLLGFSPKDLDSINNAIGRLRLGLTRIIDSLVPAFEDILGGAADIVRGFVVIIAGILNGDFAAVWRGIKGIVRGALRGAFGVIELMIAPFRAVLKRLGEVFPGPFRAAGKVIGSILRDIKNATISAINFVISLINKIHFKVPKIVPIIGGDSVGVHIDPIETKPSNNLGKLPKLTKTPRSLRASASRNDGGLVQQFGDIVLPPAPAAAVPDARYQARQFALAVARAGG